MSSYRARFDRHRPRERTRANRVDLPKGKKKKRESRQKRGRYDEGKKEKGGPLDPDTQLDAIINQAKKAVRP